MDFRIADSFTQSLGRLTGDEQKAVKTAAFDLQLNPANPGFSFHKLDRAKDKNFWSVRVNRDLRIIVHRSDDSLLLSYVDHHDDAYAWAERRKLEVHPKTGAAQMVVIRETVQEIVIPVYKEETVPITQKPKLLFESIPDETLLSYGVPEEWLNDVRNATEESLFSLTDLLPGEAAEALLELATGGSPSPVPSYVESINPYAHPDAQRRFRTLQNTEELERALDFPWDRWAVFLHPEQQQLVSKEFNGPARVSGSAGTGKTIVAIHRAVFLARKYEDARVLLTTFSPILANALRSLLHKLISNEPQLAERIDVSNINDIGIKLYRANITKPDIIDTEELTELVKKYAQDAVQQNFSLSFLQAEWEQVVDSWNIHSWEEYRDVKRLGRKTRLPEKQRQVLWSVFEKISQELSTGKKVTYAMVFHKLAEYYSTSQRFPYEFIVVDEAQDISVPQLKLLAAVDNDQANRLFFTGDTGQRIFQQPFSWKALGVDIRGRSKTLYVNYRTSHQIRQQADLLLGPEISDADGNMEERNTTVSLFNGPAPMIESFDTQDEEQGRVRSWIEHQIKHHTLPHEIAVFVRSDAEIKRATKALSGLSAPYVILDEKVETLSGAIVLSTMHFAKGLEFKSVVVMACDDEIIPSQTRIDEITDQADLEEVYNTERHLLYVACTRARENLLVTSVKPASEFLEDLMLNN